MLRFQKFQKLLEIFFAEECLHCRASGQILCDKCLASIPREKFRKLNSEQKSVTINLSAFPWVHSGLLYRNHILQKSIYYLKYHHTKSIAKYLAEISYPDFYDFLAGIVKEKNCSLEKIILLPIPISKKRLLERDYNQSEVLLREIAKKIERERGDGFAVATQKCCPILPDLLHRAKHTVKFAHTHSAADRENLIQDAFKVNEKYSEDFLSDKVIILFDDVTTTGATFYEARKTLLNAGVTRDHIFAYALAH